MALKPQGNNILAGTNLAIAQVNSPNFVTEVSGWIIRQDGSAEFNNVVIRGGEVIGGTSLTYSSSPPVAGNLIQSSSAAGGTDAAGNVYLPGQVSYTPVASGFIAVQIFAGAVFWYHAATEAGPWTGIAEIIATQALSGQVTFQISGGSTAKLLVTGDGNVYNMASLTIPMTPVTQLFNSTNAVTINNLTANVEAGVTYRFRGEVQFAGGQGAGTANFQFGTNGAFSTQWGDAEIHDAVTGTSAYVARPTGLGTFTSPTLTTNNWFAKFDALATCTTSGAVSLQAFCSVAADVFTVKNGFMEIIPLA